MLELACVFSGGSVVLLEDMKAAKSVRPKPSETVVEHVVPLPQIAMRAPVRKLKISI